MNLSTFNSDFNEEFKIMDNREREIESYFIDPEMSDVDRVNFVLRKGNYSQKICLLQNFSDFLSSKLVVEAFLNYFQDKFDELEQELQSKIIATMSKFYSKKLNLFVDHINEHQVNSIVSLLVKSCVNDERNEKNLQYINFFKILANYYENKKMSIDQDFITYVVNLASFGKSPFSRKYSVIFSSGFTIFINEFNMELVERFFRSSKDIEHPVRLAISQGYLSVGKYIKNKPKLIYKLLSSVSIFYLD